MVDPDDELTDVRMPASGTDGHVTLLIAEHLAAARQTGSVSASCTRSSARWPSEYRAYWRRSTPIRVPRSARCSTRWRRCARCAWSRRPATTRV